jgi:copper chaperone NosL
MCQNTTPRPDRRRVLAGLLGTASAAGLGFVPAAARAEAATVDLPPPGPRDTCPVCGMIVAKYPEWVATVLYDDGFAVHFDGAKDFFKYLQDMEKYAPDRSLEQIVGMGVTEYYGLKLVDARAADYVIGSDIYGPMGHELIPLQTQVDADDFLKDHHGLRQVGFDDVTMDMLTGLDRGKFE